MSIVGSTLRVHGAEKPVLLLHGFTGSGRTWDGVDLGPGHSAVTLDLPGHGEAGVAPRGTSFDDVVEGVMRALDEGGLSRLSLLGYSQGGRIALGLLTRFPERFDVAVLESTSAGLPEAGERARRAAADDALADDIERDGLEAFVERWLGLPLFASLARLPPAERERDRAARMDGTAAGYASALRTMTVGRQPDLWPALGGVRAKVLVVAGEEDVKYVGLARRLGSALPDATVRVIPEAGHTVHLEQPGPFWSEVRSFLADRRASEEGVA